MIDINQNIEKLTDYLSNVEPTNLKELERRIKAPSVKTEYEVILRDNPAFFTKSRIAPQRELRRLETARKVSVKKFKGCLLCNHTKDKAKFPPGLNHRYFLNDSSILPNLFPSGEIHGIVVYNYKKHDKSPAKLSLNNWADGIKLVQEVGKHSKKKYVSSHINYGPKAASSLEHFHGQFHCEDEPLSKTRLALKLVKELSDGKSWWKSWISSMLKEGLVIDFDPESKVVMYSEWSPVFGKSELVILNFESPSFMSMNEKEIETVAKYLSLGVKITNEISDQFNIINLSAAQDDNFCNQFRICSRAPLSNGLKAWEGYLELMGETVPCVDPKKLVEISKTIK